MSPTYSRDVKKPIKVYKELNKYSIKEERRLRQQQQILIMVNIHSRGLESSTHSTTSVEMTNTFI